MRPDFSRDAFEWALETTGHRALRQGAAGAVDGTCNASAARGSSSNSESATVVLNATATERESLRNMVTRPRSRRIIRLIGRTLALGK
jgi:hypothetical protein